MRLELANACSGHHHCGVETGRFNVDQSVRPFVYQRRGISGSQPEMAIGLERA